MKHSFHHYLTVCALTGGLFITALTSCSNINKQEQANQETKQENQAPEQQNEGTILPDSTGYIVRVGQMAPDFNAQLTDGKKINLSDFRSKVVMLQFTASWCGVCRKEMPHIEQQIWQKHKNNPHFVLIGIDRDEPLDKLINFGKSTGITYPLALDPGADIFAKYATRESGITRNVLIDRDGKIVRLTRLFNEEEFSALVKDIDALLAQ